MEQKMTKPVFSVVVPIYNSEKMIPLLYERVKKTIDEMGLCFEVVFVNDGSHDKSWDILKQMHETYDNVRIFNLSKNYGQQKALMTGLRKAQGEYVITMDDDLQNPPEEIPILYNKMLEGFDVVIGKYAVKQHRKIQNIGSFLFRKLSNHIFNNKEEIKFTSFRMIKCDVVRAISQIKVDFPYISGMLMSVTNSITNVLIRHDQRLLGKSSYKLSSLINLAVQLILNYSLLPLKALSWMGLIISISSFGVSTTFIIRKLILGQVPPGWTALVVLMSMYNAVTMIAFLILGNYIGRILAEISDVNSVRIKEQYE